MMVIGSYRASGNEIDWFFDVQGCTALNVPLMVSLIICGFPSPADDYLDQPPDFNELLIINPPATFAARATGLSMTGAGIYPGDIVIIDRSITPQHRSIVLALVEWRIHYQAILPHQQRGHIAGGKPGLPRYPAS